MNKYTRVKQIYEGKAKKLYTLKGYPQLLLQECPHFSVSSLSPPRAMILARYTLR